MDSFTQERVTVDSWCEAQEELFLDSWRDDINRFRPPFAYRGISREYDSLPTSLIRLGRKQETERFETSHGADVEADILRNFIKYAKKESLSSRSEWHQLSVAQHYGLPTRILDWTFSPLVALHFATSGLSHLDEPGEIWVVNIDAVHEKLPDELADLMGGHVFTIDELNDVADSLSDFDDLFNEKGIKESPIFFEPPSLDGRIVNQFALFSIFPDSEQYFDDWLDKHPNLYKKVIIQPNAKMEIRDKLDASNITERVLFPGLDGLANWLTRYYTPITENETRNPD
ncbi:FRG domain-containing protein [Halomicrococcus sp. NG-SE-24]|uniref:FRG domain-containing protein n=1 Tax=Halomicrococcus sp. NG-SE-24 TaxID=3436928 RepID=UPI003D98D2C3